MLIALITILFLGGSSSGFLDYIADTREGIKTVLPKDDRQKEALATVKEMKKRTKARNKQVRGSFKSLGKLMQSEEPDFAEFDAVWEGYFEELGNYNRGMIELRFELKDHVTREEWAQIFPAD